MEKNLFDGSVNDKIKNISEYIKNNVITPAEEEKLKIIEEAQKNAAEIIKNAEKRANEIIIEAEKKAAHEKNALESSLRIAAKQSIDALKIAFEKEIFRKGIELPAKESLKKEDVIKSFIAEVLQLHISKGIAGETEITIPQENKAAIIEMVKEFVAKNSTAKISIAGDTIPNGFAVTFKEHNLSLEFTDQSVTELIAEFLRPELRKFLFEK